MLPVEIDQVSKGLDRVITDLSEKDNFIKLLTIFLEESQELEEAVIDLADQKNINTSDGVWLDYIGGIVGEDRQGKDDIAFRSAINTRIGINTSDGTPNNIINLTKAHTSGNSKLINYYPAGFFTVVDGTVGLDAGLFNLVQGIKPAGVEATVVSNLLGENFVPAWLNDASTTTVQQDFLLDEGTLDRDFILDAGDDFLLDAGDGFLLDETITEGDEFLLDDGIAGDVFGILTPPEDSFTGSIEFSVLSWVSEDFFEVNNNGSIEPLELSIGEDLTVATFPTVDISLAQVITQDTIAIV